MLISGGNLSGHLDGISLWEGDIKGNIIDNRFTLSLKNQRSKATGLLPVQPEIDFALEGTMADTTISGSYSDKCYVGTQVQAIKGSFTGKRIE